MTINHGAVCIAYDKHLIEQNKSTLTLEWIRFCVLSYFGVSEAEFCSTGRKRPITTVRKVFSKLCKTLTVFSLKGIGKYIGGRDHSTVYYELEEYDNLLLEIPAIAQHYENISAIIFGNPIPYPDLPPLQEKTISEIALENGALTIDEYKGIVPIKSDIYGEEPTLIKHITDNNYSYKSAHA